MGAWGHEKVTRDMGVSLGFSQFVRCQKVNLRQFGEILNILFNARTNHMNGHGQFTWMRAHEGSCCHLHVLAGVGSVQDRCVPLVFISSKGDHWPQSRPCQHYCLPHQRDLFGSPEMLLFLSMVWAPQLWNQIYLGSWCWWTWSTGTWLQCLGMLHLIVKGWSTGSTWSFESRTIRCGVILQVECLLHYLLASRWSKPCAYLRLTTRCLCSCASVYCNSECKNNDLSCVVLILLVTMYT